jgi:hypothetical protein
MWLFALSRLSEHIPQYRDRAIELARDVHRDRRVQIDQDLGLGMMLWLSHFFPQEDWAKIQGNRSLAMLDHMWVDPPGYFCRTRHLRQIMFAFTNYGISLGLQAVGGTPDRIVRLNQYFDHYRSGDHYDSDAITHVMACTSHFPGAFLQAM